MSTKPILFNTEMVKAILEGRKTVTRRIIKRDLLLCCDFDTDGTICGCHDKDGDWYEIEDFAPYQIDDIMYIRETWSKSSFGYIYRTDDLSMITNSDEEITEVKWHPSIHMPKEAARIWLKVTNVRVERLQDITQEDVRKEGCVDDCCMCSFNNKYEEHEIDCSKGIKKIKDCDLSNMFPKTGFRNLWDSTIKKQDLDKYGWNANPYVWVIEFERIEKGDI